MLIIIIVLHRVVHYSVDCFYAAW